MKDKEIQKLYKLASKMMTDNCNLKERNNCEWCKLRVRDTCVSMYYLQCLRQFMPIPGGENHG